MIIDAKDAPVVAFHQMILHFSEMVAALFGVDFENMQSVTGGEFDLSFPDYRLPVLVIRQYPDAFAGYCRISVAGFNGSDRALEICLGVEQVNPLKQNPERRSGFCVAWA